MRLVAQAYGPIFAAGQTMAIDAGAQTGQRARRRGREDDDEDEMDENADGSAM